MPRFGLLGRNSIWMLGSRLCSQGLAVLLSLLLARSLGSAGFGAYAFMAAAVYIGNSLTTFGTDMHLIRQIARTDDLSGLPAALVLQLALSALFIAGTALYVPLVRNLSAQAAEAVTIYSLSLLPLGFFTVFSTALRGKQRMRTYMAINLSSAALQVAAVAIAISGGTDLVRLAILLTLGQTGAAALSGWLCARQLSGFWKPWRFLPGQLRPLVVVCAPIALLSLVGMVYQKLPIYLLTVSGGAAVTGWFSAAVRVVEAAKTGHLAVFTALYPALARNCINASPPWSGAFGRPWRLLLASSILIALGLTIVAGPAAQLLYGPDFTPAVPALRILGWVLVPFTINTFFTLQLLSTHQEWFILRVHAAGLLLSAGLMAWWIPVWGLNGACLACLLAEACQSAAYMLPARFLPSLVFKRRTA